MANRIIIKKSQLQKMINEQMVLLREQQENNAIASTTTKFAGKFKTTPTELYNTAKDVMNSKNPNELKQKILDKNPNLDSKKTEKISQEFIKTKQELKKPNKKVRTLYSLLQILYVILSLMFAVFTNSGLAYGLLGMSGFVATILELKKRGFDLFANLDKYNTTIEQELDKAEREDSNKWYYAIKWGSPTSWIPGTKAYEERLNKRSKQGK